MLGHAFVSPCIWLVTIPWKKINSKEKLKAQKASGTEEMFVFHLSSSLPTSTRNLYTTTQN